MRQLTQTNKRGGKRRIGNSRQFANDPELFRRGAKLFNDPLLGQENCSGEFVAEALLGIETRPTALGDKLLLGASKKEVSKLVTKGKALARGPRSLTKEDDRAPTSLLKPAVLDH